MHDEAYIQLIDVCKAYVTNDRKNVVVLEDFCLSVSRGEILSLYGPNGCGKSTILGIIAQITPKDKGTVLVGRKMPHVGDIGCLFQDYNASLFPWISCAENISFSLRLYGVSKTVRRNKAFELAEELRISVDLDKFPYQLSGGQQQLIALARALCNSPSAIVMDEPFSSLDSTMREHVRTEVVRIISELGLTAILVSHNLEDCLVCSDRVVFLTPLPARVNQIETVPLEGKRHEREIYSDHFATVLESFHILANEAREQ